MIDFCIKVNKKDKDWLFIKSFEINEDDVQPSLAGTCLVHLENNEAAIYAIGFFNKHKVEFMEKLEAFLKTLYIKKISIGLLEGSSEENKIKFLESIGYKIFDKFLTKDFKDMIYIYEKYLDYKTPWENLIFIENCIQYNQAIEEMPEGYRLPTIKDIEIFKSLYTVNARFDKIDISNSKKESFSINKEKFKNKGFNYTYNNNFCFWTDSASQDIMVSACLCENRQVPMIVPRSRYLSLMTVYIKD